MEEKNYNNKHFFTWCIMFVPYFIACLIIAVALGTILNAIIPIQGTLAAAFGLGTLGASITTARHYSKKYADKKHGYYD